MTDYVMRCDTFARLASVLGKTDATVNEWFNSVRVDDGVAVCTNRRVMAVERIGGGGGVIHVIADAALIAQCKAETPFASDLTITVNEPLRYAVAKTTLGYVHPANCCVWSDAPNEFDKWRMVVDRCRQPAMEAKGVNFWDAANIANLASASPSGAVTFEEIIDATRPMVVRDVVDPDWFGVFIPSDPTANYVPATLPEWI